MQFKSDIKIFKLWLILLALIPNGYPLACIVCNDQDCAVDEIGFNCTEDLVLVTHEHLAELNPSLDGVVPSVGAEFACFKLNAAVVVDTDISIPVIEHGCTLPEVNFCDGWADDVIVHDCDVCQSDRCNMAQAPPEGSVAPPEVGSTTVNPNGSGSGVDVAVRVGNWLVVGAISFSLMVHRF